MKSYRTLALKELLSQKVTSILILIAVVLSTMMTTIVGQSIGVLSAMREQQAIAIGGNRYATFLQMNAEQLHALEQDERLSYVGKSIYMGSLELSPSLTLGLMEYWDDTAAIYPSSTSVEEGRLPEAPMEIALSEDILKYLGFEGGIGDKITLSLQKNLRHNIADSYSYTAEFVLTGILKNNYLGYTSGTVTGVVGEGTAEQLLTESYIYYNVDIRTADKKNFQAVVDDINKEFNIHELDTSYNIVYLNALGISYTANSEGANDKGFSFMTVAGILVGTLILLAAGLVIYNILKISVSKRIKGYGTLRAKMLRLLELVNTGMYAGVICIDIERLSRGSSLESGYIMQVLQTNNCKIITPSKIYDLQNESDEQFTDMKFMFSRYELKTITKRLVRGRNQSASEGKFLGSVAPYGYRAYKLVGMKGNSLRIEPKEAKVVRMIFDMYGKQGIGYNTIAHELNQMNIPSLTGTWGQTSITNILNNEVYLGMIRWKHEPTKRVVKDGMLTKKRVTSKDYELYEGLHEPIIDQEQWDRVKAVQSSRNHASVHKDKKLMNPFATILFCEKCGAVMKRNVPAKTQNTSPWYRCPTRGCNCRTIKCDFLEAEVVKAMSQWWGEYTIKIKEDKVAQTDSTETALSIVREQLTELQLQQDKICEYLEKGIYTIEMFTKRNDTLTREIHKVQAAENELLKKQGAQKDIHDVEKEIIPTTQHILDSYPQLSVEEKNRLWKIVMERITAYRTPGGEVSIHIYPKLPMR